ncbi:MAG: alpha-glucan family phosphorylase [Deltaproteobacteria bacterium]|nr:alpha-glucan family phosphorylase [Deltaproteobacteria bacterium]
MNQQRSIAYFSMEIGIDNSMPTYSGGLGILAGDTIRSGADLKVPMVAITLIYRKGYFRQRIDENGWQHEEPVGRFVEEFLEEIPQRVSIFLEGRKVKLRAWRYTVQGISGFTAPVYFLDANLPENTEWDRRLTDHLYGGDEYYRLCQEVILGIGGVKMLRALGYDNISRFHMNEGHAAFLTLELLREERERKGVSESQVEAVRGKCIFTTHTPVLAGHDKFPLDILRRVLGIPEILSSIESLAVYEGLFNMTYLALNMSSYVNGVAKKHGEVSRLMFAGYEIDAITNGVHAATWVSEPFQELFNLFIPEWKEDNFSLRAALGIPVEDIMKAHTESKRNLFDYVKNETGVDMDENILTIGFARRSASYKRGAILFEDMGRLEKIALNAGPLQFIYSGKAHPRDQGGKEIIKRIFDAAKSLQDKIKIVYLQDYNMDLAKKVVAGVDVWLNTPQPPMEASGTSGMKAAMNGVPSLSVLDGWWVEGHIEGITGWAMGESDHAKDAASLYEKLENIVIPTFYHNRNYFIEIMRYSIALNGSFFNTHRMMQEYVLKAYF